MVGTEEQVRRQIRDVVLTHPLTGEQRRVAWLQKIRVIHKNLPGDHADETCWCRPLVNNERDDYKPLEANE